jgi:hypothetical protein
MLWAKGKEAKRDRQTEIILRRLSTRKQKGLLSVRYGNKKVYALRKRGRSLDESTIYHGLACTECLVRFYRSKTEGEIIPEKSFTGCGLVPDGGITYPNNTILLWEFSTKSNVLFHRLIEGKLRAYERNLPIIEEKFNGKAGVVYILDVDRATVERKLEKWKDTGPYWFTDYETFLKVEIGNALTAPIYFRPDGRVEPIKK